MAKSMTLKEMATFKKSLDGFSLEGLKEFALDLTENYGKYREKYTKRNIAFIREELLFRISTYEVKNKKGGTK